MKESQNEINYARIAEAIRFYATCCIESELLYVKSLNNGLVKVTDYTDYQIANNRHARAITKELLNVLSDKERNCL